MAIQNVNGINIHYELAGEGPALVLLHGLQGDASTFDSLMPALSKHFHVLRFDQRGSGLTDKPDEAYSIEMLADDTVGLMQSLGIESANIFGVSLGGMIAQSLALKYPEQVQKLILACTLPGGFTHGVKHEPHPQALVAFSPDEAINPKVRAEALAEIAFAPGFVDQHPDIINRLVEMREAKPIDQTGLARRAGTVGDFEIYDQLPNIHHPTWVVTGEEDQLIDAENSRRLAAQIPGAKLTLYPNAGHMFWEESNTFMSDVLENLQ